MAELFDFEVTTILLRQDGSPVDEVIVKRWGATQAAIDWLTGSCKTTAFWLMDFGRATGAEWYTLRYRTVVRQGALVVSDTTLVDFPYLTYTDMRRFEVWAQDQLREMREVIASENDPFADEPVTRRSKLLAILSFGWQIFRNKNVRS